MEIYDKVKLAIAQRRDRIAALKNSLEDTPWDKQDEVLEAIHGLELEISELEGYLEETIHVNECDTYEGLSLDEIIKREREATRKAREQQEKEQEDFER